MNSRASNVGKIAAAVGSALLAPFIIMELVYAQTSYSNFPIPLFGVLWLLTAVFTAVLIRMVRTLKAGNGGTFRYAGLVLGAVALVIVASMWGSIVIDQMPCFL